MSESVSQIQDIDYSGRRFGYLIVLHRDPERPKRHWICVCDCGNETSVSIYNLLSGNTRRCADRHCKTRVHDLTGNRFGKLTAISFAGFRSYGTTRTLSMWDCICDCGQHVIVPTSSLLSGHTQSCGCLQSEVQSARNRTHGGANSRLYKEYRNMKSRCNNPSATGYMYYGGRGISVCNEWMDSFEAFRDWSLHNGYKDDLTIDRIDTNGNYSPSNCRWTTYGQQARNTRRNRYVYLKGRRMVLADALRTLGATYWHFQWLCSRNKGLSDDEIIEMIDKENDKNDGGKHE